MHVYSVMLDIYFFSMRSSYLTVQSSNHPPLHLCKFPIGPLLLLNSIKTSNMIFSLEVLLECIFIHAPNLAQFTQWALGLPLSGILPAKFQLLQFSLMLLTSHVHFKCIFVHAPNSTKSTMEFRVFSPSTVSLAHFQPLQFGLVFVTF